MKFYLSASFDRREELRQYREQIRAAGHGCRCRWLDNADPEFERRAESLDVPECTIAASVDWDDIREAEQKIVRIVGQPEHIFHATMRQCATFTGAFANVLEVCDA